MKWLRIPGRPQSACGGARPAGWRVRRSRAPGTGRAGVRNAAEGCIGRSGAHVAAERRALGAHSGRAVPGDGCGRGGSAPGFTLLEALVALVLLGTVIVATVEAFAGGLRAEAGLDRHLAAVALAERRMSELALLPRDSLLQYRAPRSGGFAAPFGGYRWRVLVRPAGEPQELMRAAVLVEWDDGDFALETVFYRPDPLPPALRRGP